MKTVIDGAGQIGSHLAKLLLKDGWTVTVVDSDESRLEALAAVSDVETVQGEPASPQVLKKAGVGKADLFISVVPFAAQEINIVAAQMAKKLGAKKTISRVISPELLEPSNQDFLTGSGIDFTLCPEMIAADELVGIIGHSASVDAMDIADGKLQIAAFRLGEESPLPDMTLKDFVSVLSPEELSCFRLIAIARGNETIIPRPDTRFRYADLVYAVSRKDTMSGLHRRIGVSGIATQSLMIMGGGAIGMLAARKLSGRMEAVKIVDNDRRRCAELDAVLPENIIIVNGDGRDTDFLSDESIRDYDAFAALTGNDEVNILSCVAARKFGVRRTIAEVENLEYVRMAEEMGVDNIINKKLAAAGHVFRFTLSDKTKFVKYMSGTDAEVLEYTVSEGSAITKAPLKDLNFPVDAVIGGVIRASEGRIAVGSTKIEPGDQVAIFALPHAVPKVDKFFK